MNLKRLATAGSSAALRLTMRTNQQCPKENLEHIVAIIKKTLTH